MESVLDAALYAAETLHIPVLPLGTKSKTPVTENGVHDATTDTDVIRDYYEKHPNRNLGFAMGNGFVAIDIDKSDDDGADGYDSLLNWELENGDLPSTATTSTGGGGCHMIYRVDRPVGNCVNSDLHIDIRGDGGYIMAPPSIHPNGNQTTWTHDPKDVGIAEADAVVYAFLDYVSGGSDKKSSKRFDLPESIGKGERNDMLFRFGCSLRSKDVREDVIAFSISDANNTRCKPPLPQYEVDKIIESVLDIEPGLSAEAQSRAVARRSTPAKKTKSFDHAKFADEMIAEDHACVIDGVVAIFRDGCYRIGKRPVESAMIARKHDIKSRERTEVMKYLEIEAPEKQLSANKYIAFTNCVIDIKTMDTYDMSPEWVIPNIIPHNWNPNANNPIVVSTFMKIAMGDPAIMKNLFEVIGYSMYRGSELGTCPILFGTGQNGKSTYLNMLHSILGDRNVSSLDVATIGERFQSVALIGKLANIGDDISNEFVSGSKASFVKKIVTGDWTQAEYKGGDTFQFKPYCTLIFSCNEFPRIGDSSEGMMRRLHPIKFGAKFTKSDPDYDPYIEEKLATEDAIETAIYYGINALRECLDNREFTQTEASVAELENIRLTNSTVYQFVVDDLNFGSEDATDIMHMPTSELHERYLHYCDNLKIRTPVQHRKFSLEIESIYDCEIEREYVETYGGRRRLRCFVPKKAQILGNPASNMNQKAS